jgi:hypothetical protein
MSPSKRRTSSTRQRRRKIERAAPTTEEALADADEAFGVDIKPPPWWLMALEMRALLEFGSSLSLLATGVLQREAARGDGHAVLVLPGFVASDRSTVPLRGFLSSRGFEAHGWGLGLNTGPHRHYRHSVIDDLADKVRSLRASSGRRISLVGWSLGGVFAREVAKRVPQTVRAVVTLGSPFNGAPDTSNAWRLYQLVSGDRRHHFDQALIDALAEPPPVPTTSIYSRSDGVVAWPSSVGRTSAQMENVEVQASHFGLGVHPLVWIAVADRLAQPEGAWQPFERRGWRAMAYPLSPADAR